MRDAHGRRLVNPRNVGNPRIGMTLLNSGRRAAQGFRILSAWCLDCLRPTTQRLFIVSVAAIVVIYLLLMGLPSLRKTSGPAGTVESYANSGSGGHSSALVLLHRPQRPFHGNHWYHMGEYYLSRRHLLQTKLELHSDPRTPYEHIRIVAHNHKLTGPMTKMAFSILVLACLSDNTRGNSTITRHSNVQSIVLYAPKTVSLFRHPLDTTINGEAGALSEGDKITFRSEMTPILGYFAQLPPEERFVDYRTKAPQKKRKPKRAADELNKRRDGSDGDGRSGQNIVESNAQARVWETPAGDACTAGSTNRKGSLWQRLTISVSTSATPGCSDEVTYIGTIGETPIPTGEWFHSVEEADSVRRTALSICGVATSSGGSVGADGSGGSVGEEEGHEDVIGTHPRTLKLLIYQRDLNRRFLHLHKVVAQLRARNLNIHGGLYRWEVTVLTHDEQMDPCGLYKALHEADVLLTAHGFQSTGLMFMHRGATLIEIFPYKYHRTTYVPLASQFGLHYYWAQNAAPSEGKTDFLSGLTAAVRTGQPSAQLLRTVSQGACMRDLQCRSYARSRDIDMPTDHVQLVLQVMSDVEQRML